MIWRIDVFPKNKEVCRELINQIKDLGIQKDCRVFAKKVYLIDSKLQSSDIQKIADKLLIDSVIEDYSLNKGLFSSPPAPNQLLITHNPGVCDPVALSLDKAIKDLFLEVESVKTARFYEFQGLEENDIEYLASKILYNPLIEHALDYEATKDLATLDEFSGQSYDFKLIPVDMLAADDKLLCEISDKGCLSLSLDEMKIIQSYFVKLGRNPTDCELETIATLWSEHCAHKTFRGIIEYEEKDSLDNQIRKETIDNLLKSTVMRATKELNSPLCVSVFHDNSGVIDFDKDHNVCFKVETHNHPSSLEPYGGASTGIGGVIRDILGTGCAARPFASLDVFCFSPWDISYKDLPKGLLHPKRVINGVVRGVRDYGNRMGIPTVAGAVLFEERFLGNPLVYCGTLGIMPKDKSHKKAQAGDLVVLCGARTGRDGIHGATFSSKELDEQTVSLTSAVQIGNPIEEKKLTEAIIRARDENLFNAITDCGAGGISSAITELGQDHGVEINLEKVPLKYRGLTYTEIWISESQERMVFFTKEENISKLQKIFSEEDVELTIVGKVTNTKKLVLFYQGTKVCDLGMDFIFELPKLKKKAVWVHSKEKDSKLKEHDNYNEDLLLLMARPNVACKDWVLREYDHEVQAGSVLKSIYGIDKAIVSDASLVRPDLNNEKCIAIGLGINPSYSDIDPYWMAASAIDEALRNVVACGGKLDKTFILDNFSWGSPQDEKILGDLVRASLSCYDFSTYFGVPFISGKDSLYNEYDVGKKHISIPGTLLISALSILDDWRKTITAPFKQIENHIYIVGFTKPELGASEYFKAQTIKQGLVPKVNKENAKSIFDKLSKAIDKGLVLSCHDLSEGGLSVCLSEMCIGSDLGANIFLEEVPTKQGMLSYEILFSESPTRFVVEVEKDKKDIFEKELKDIPFGLNGCVSNDERLKVYGKDCKLIIDLSLKDIYQSWISTFNKFR